MEQRVIRIFLSTPSDIVEERRALVALAAEINDVVAFLAPERNVQLKVLHYETDAYPDVVGSPQEVIDEQIPADYDIHLGIMWRRAGTPTKTADSGTIHEFERALVQREKTGKPTIMFYFCSEDVAFPTTADEIDQLAKVMKFRERFRTIGLAATYPKRAEFRERARINLLRAVADILREGLPNQRPVSPPREPAPVPEPLEKLCDEYDLARRTPFGPRRTERMTAIMENMKRYAPNARDSLQQLKSHASAGRRLAAIAILQVFPSREELRWLADRLDPQTEKAFVGFQAAAALLQATRSLPDVDRPLLLGELERARQLAALNPNDPPRIKTLDYAIKELQPMRQ